MICLLEMGIRRNCCVILSIIFLLNCINVGTACGPGGGARPDVPIRKFNGDRIPDVSEDASLASGRFEGPLAKDDKALKKIINTDIIFEDPSYDAESRKSIESCELALIQLAGVTKQYWKGKYKLYVTEGYLSIKKASHRTDSLHYAGRAFDITLVNAKPSIIPAKKYDKVKYHMLRNLGYLAYYNAKFSFVRIKQHHIHVSCPKTSARKTTSRCFHGDSMVRASNGNMLKMKDVQVGDSVLTMNSFGMPVYSEVTMIMHRNKDVVVDDYLQITTSGGEEITLSSYHLIFISTTESIFSKDVKLGQTIYTYNSQSNQFVEATVSKIEKVTKTGAYAPLTNEGTIVVDDVYASCYALFPSHRISHAVFSVWRGVYPLIKYFQSTSQMLSTSSEYHWYADFFRKSINSLSIFPYSL